MKFTFRKEKPETGLANVGNPYPDTEIKVNKKVVGSIVPPSWRSSDNKWRIRLAVKKGDSWVWTKILVPFDDEPAARKWLNDHAAQIEKEFSLHSFED